MIYGYPTIEEQFKELVNTRRLAHAYCFYGEPQLGKFSHASALARYAEKGIFDIGTDALQEVLVVEPSATQEGGSESIGIDVVRSISHFLYQTPIHSPYRIVIIRNGQYLTDEAQNALLKILEEPPVYGVIIITAHDSSVLLPAVRSRMQRIYFGRLRDSDILDFVKKNDIIIPEKYLVQDFFGRIGRVITLCNEDASVREQARAYAHQAISASTDEKKNSCASALYEHISEENSFFDIFIEELIILLREKMRTQKDFHISSSVFRTITEIHTLSVQKRIHIKKILWEIL